MALDSHTKVPVISLDACWEDRAEDLRRRAEELECSVCRGPVLTRAGEQNRWHFAHKNANDCPLSHTDSDRMVGRAMLYKWLASKGLRERLTLEETVTIGGKLHQVDCVVSGSDGLQVAYLFFAAGVQGEQARHSLLDVLRARYSYCHFMFHAKTIKNAGSFPNGIFTSPTHRMALRLYNSCEYYHDSSMPLLAPDSLHVIEPRASSLTTYRELRCKLPPRVFTGQSIISPLLQVRISPKTGELVHPSEGNLFSGRSQRRAKEQEAREKQRNFGHRGRR